MSCIIDIVDLSTCPSCHKHLGDSFFCRQCREARAAEVRAEIEASARNHTCGFDDAIVEVRLAVFADMV